MLGISSLLFYAWGGVSYVALMLISIGIGYVFGLLIDNAKSEKSRKVFLFLSVLLELSLLIYFKYADFFISNFNGLTGLDVPLLKVVLPIGISFYTFQILSYLVDVYRKEVPAQKNIVSLTTYIALFPQLIAGPIVRYSDIAKELDDRSINFDKFYAGIQRFVIGLSKKILIANQLGEFCDVFRGIEDKTVLFYWAYAIAFMLHIYFDFSGYSDMAIGLGKIFGFTFLENFNYPYISKSITEFWRRWHMSLGTWFRDYVYIPLGGNRVSKGRHYMNIFIVWMLTGFWHGADWNYILWGVYFWVFLVLEKAFLRKWLEKCKPAAHLYSLLVIAFGWTIFFHSDLSVIASSAMQMIGIGATWGNESVLYTLLHWLPFLVICGFACTPYPKKITEWLKNKFSAVEAISPFVLAILLLLSVAFMVNDTFSPFLYYIF